MLLYVVIAAGIQRKGLLYRIDKERPLNTLTVEELFEMEDKLREQNEGISEITILSWTELAENEKKGG